MASFLYKIGKFSYRRWWAVLALWILAIIALGALGDKIEKPFKDDFKLPDSPSVTAQNTITEKFPEGKAAEGQPAKIILKADDGQRLDTGAHHDSVEKMVAKLQEIPQLVPAERAKIIDPTTGPAAAQSMTDNGTVAIIKFTLDAKMHGAESGVSDATVNTVTEAKKIGRDAGLTVESAGPVSAKAVEPPSELIGIAVAILVMIITFAGLLAAAMPLGAAIMGIVVSTSVISIGTAFLTLGTSTTGLATMIGLAVGIDYSLFVISRYRQEATRTKDRAHAAGVAVGTAGSAVVFAGATVVIALVALNLTGLTFLGQMGLGASVTVVMAVLVSLTVLPALLGLFKGIVFKPRIPLLWTPERSKGPTIGHKVGVALTKHPLPYLIITAAALIVAAIPVTQIQLGLDATSSQDRPAHLIEREAFGAGKSSPLIVVVSAQDPTGMATAAKQVQERISGLDHIAEHGVVGPIPNTAQDAAQFLVIPQNGPSTPETKDLLAEIRSAASDVAKATGSYVGVGGSAAINADFSSALTNRLPIYLLVVVGLAFILLMIVFRSVIIPLVASIGFLLSVAATFGATVGIFQKGWLGWIKPEDQGPILVFAPIFLIGIVFGLAMDYQVFLVSRMREEYHHGASPIDAIRTGYGAGARVITAAALIMVSVFAGFTLSSETFLKLLGFSMAAAIVFDAFLVRMIIMPTTMALLGKRAWWIPRWLDRVLPNIDVEGEKLRAPEAPPANNVAGGAPVAR
ncbi:RND superfamily putative drug exporter [Amycolatopsis sulphurea]|uniref:RND superfamily putative drug exporter n=1 Tax=Amycolatopsis sulphurea TaxID=76022 RepID=A0A2A9FHL0_9PSEU|nr:MMPL family transporter [Amycolatopsis sulphurea]PFG50638.1 RND superfamily putative drug exporter [Amycolatopsis sulphurea]